MNQRNNPKELFPLSDNHTHSHCRSGKDTNALTRSNSRNILGIPSPCAAIHGALPRSVTPQNYAVWYESAAKENGRNRVELNPEPDTIKAVNE